MCSTSRISASCSIDVPCAACACSSERTASAISRRPPYPIATLTCRPGDVARRVLDELEPVRRGLRQQVEGADRVHPPATGRGEALDGVLDDLDQRAELLLRPGRGCPARASRASRPRRRPPRTSRGTRGSCPRPRWWPWLGPAPIARAQRRLPSMRTPMCRGTEAGEQGRGHAPLVRAVQQLAQPHASPPLARSAERPSVLVAATVPPRRRRRGASQRRLSHAE